MPTGTTTWMTGTSAASTTTWAALVEMERVAFPVEVAIIAKISTLTNTDASMICGKLNIIRKIKKAAY